MHHTPGKFVQARHSRAPSYSEESTLEVTQGQILSQSLTDATRFWWHLYGSWLKRPSICPWVASRVVCQSASPAPPTQRDTKGRSTRHAPKIQYLICKRSPMYLPWVASRVVVGPWLACHAKTHGQKPYREFRLQRGFVVQGYLAHREVPPIGPYSRTMPRALWRS